MKFTKKSLKSFSSIASDLKLPRSSLQDQFEEYEYFKEVKGRNHKFRLENAGRKTNSLKIEKEIVKWISEQRFLEIAINSNEIIAKYIQLGPSQKDKNYFSLHSWCFRFLKRYGFSIRIIFRTNNPYFNSTSIYKK